MFRVRARWRIVSQKVATQAVSWGYACPITGGAKRMKVRIRIGDASCALATTFRLASVSALVAGLVSACGGARVDDSVAAHANGDVSVVSFSAGGEAVGGAGSAGRPWVVPVVDWEPWHPPEAEYAAAITPTPDVAVRSSDGRSVVEWTFSAEYPTTFGEVWTSSTDPIALAISQGLEVGANSVHGVAERCAAYEMGRVRTELGRRWVPPWLVDEILAWCGVAGTQSTNHFMRFPMHGEMSQAALDGLRDSFASQQWPQSGAGRRHGAVIGAGRGGRELWLLLSSPNLALEQADRVVRPGEPVRLVAYVPPEYGRLRVEISGDGVSTRDCTVLVAEGAYRFSCPTVPAVHEYSIDVNGWLEGATAGHRLLSVRLGSLPSTQEVRLLGSGTGAIPTAAEVVDRLNLIREARGFGALVFLARQSDALTAGHPFLLASDDAYIDAARAVRNHALSGWTVDGMLEDAHYYATPWTPFTDPLTMFDTVLRDAGAQAILLDPTATMAAVSVIPSEDETAMAVFVAMYSPYVEPDAHEDVEQEVRGAIEAWASASGGWIAPGGAAPLRAMLDQARDRVHVDGTDPRIVAADLIADVEQTCGPDTLVEYHEFERTREVTREFRDVADFDAELTLDIEVVHAYVADTNWGRHAAFIVLCEAGASVCCPGVQTTVAKH